MAKSDAIDTRCQGTPLKCDQLWTLINGIRHQLSLSILLIPTKFGYVLSGSQRRTSLADISQVMLTIADDISTWDKYWRIELGGWGKFESIMDFEGQTKNY